jgi:opacity protein-like surface antigen
MKPLSRTIFTLAGAVCAAIFLTPSPAPAAEENFFQKFIVQEPMNWSGPYIGFNNGATFNHFHVGKQMTDVDLTDQFYDLGTVVGVSDFFATFHTPGHSETDTQTIGGGQTGFRFQFGHFVVGGEGGFSGNGSGSSAKFGEFQMHQFFVNTEGQQFITSETEFTSMDKVETTWNGFAGGNVGFAWNRFLFYGEGGAAFTDVHFESTKTADTSFFQNCNDGCGGDGLSTPVIRGRNVRRVAQPQPGQIFIGEIVSKKTHTQGDVLTGWYGGGGVDYALTNFVSVGLEYKHVDWGNVTEHEMVGSNGGPVFPGNGHLDLNADQVMFKVNILVGALGH